MVIIINHAHQLILDFYPQTKRMFNWWFYIKYENKWEYQTKYHLALSPYILAWWDSGTSKYAEHVENTHQ